MKLLSRRSLPAARTWNASLIWSCQMLNPVPTTNDTHLFLVSPTVFSCTAVPASLGNTRLFLNNADWSFFEVIRHAQIPARLGLFIAFSFCSRNVTSKSICISALALKVFNKFYVTSFLSVSRSLYEFCVHRLVIRRDFCMSLGHYMNFFVCR